MNARGLTLVETLVAMALIGVVASALMASFVTQLYANSRNETRSAAISAAEMMLEDLRLEDPETMPSTGDSAPMLVTIGDDAFSVVAHYCERADLCASPTVRHVRVEVLQQGDPVYDVEVVFTQLR